MDFTVTELFTGPTGTALTSRPPDAPSSANWIRQTVSSVSTFDVYADGGYGGILEVKDDNIGSNGVLHWLDVDVGVDAVARMWPKLIGAYNSAGEGVGKFGDIGVVARLNWDGTSLQAADLKIVTCYLAIYRYSNHTWYIIKFDANTDVPGSPSQRRTNMASIAAASSPAPPLAIADGQRFFDFEVSGTNPVQLTLKEGGTVILSTTDNTGTKITSGQKVGVYAKAPNGNPPYMNEFYAGALEVPATVGADLALSYSVGGTVTLDLSLSYSVAAAGTTPVGADLALSYTALAAVGANLALSYAVEASPGAFTSQKFINNTGTVRNGDAVTWEWYPGGTYGALGAITPVAGSGNLTSTGYLALTGLPNGAGVLLARTTADNGFYAEPGTVT